MRLSLIKYLKMKILRKTIIHSLLFFFSLLFVLASWEKNENSDIISNDAQYARKAYTDKGYIEVEVTPIVKKPCYFAQWDKTVITPVAGLFEYYDADNNWIASIDFGDGTCDEWATKSWDVNIFPDYPSGREDFSVFDYSGKKDK